jgi:hypothetical protein
LLPGDVVFVPENERLDVGRLTNHHANVAAIKAPAVG